MQVCDMCEHVRVLAEGTVLTCHVCDVWQLLLYLWSDVVARAGKQWNRRTLSGQGLLEFCGG